VFCPNCGAELIIELQPTDTQGWELEGEIDCDLCHKHIVVHESLSGDQSTIELSC
jgi:hypothetical protein